MAKRKVDNNFLLPYAMRIARKAEPHAGTKSAWWYISPTEIVVYFRSDDSSGACSLTRQQLERALEVMNNFE